MHIRPVFFELAFVERSMPAFALGVIRLSPFLMDKLHDPARIGAGRM